LQGAGIGKSDFQTTVGRLWGRRWQQRERGEDVRVCAVEEGECIFAVGEEGMGACDGGSAEGTEEGGFGGEFGGE
jgi:hypothetical protein